MCFIKTAYLLLHLLIKICVRIYNVMGNYLTRPVSSSISIQNSWHHRNPSNLRLKYQNIHELIGCIEDWKKWKSRTECVVECSGYYRVLYDYLFVATKITDQSDFLFTSSSWNCGGKVNHLVKSVEDIKDGNY